MIYQIIFTTECEFMVDVEADSEEEAKQKFNNDEANWNTLINTGNGEPGYHAGHDAFIQEIIK